MLACARVTGRLSKRALIAENARSSKKAKEDAEDKVNYLDGIDKDDETEDEVDNEESGDLEEAIEQLVDDSNAACVVLFTHYPPYRTNDPDLWNCPSNMAPVFIDVGESPSNRCGR